MALPCGEFVMALILTAAHLPPCEAKNWRKVDTKCPELQFCYCQLIKRGAKILCRNIKSSDDLSLELSKLRNTSIFQLTVKQVNLTVLPSFYFANLKMVTLSVLDTPLKVLEDDAFANVTKLKSLHFESNMMTTIPTAFSALGDLTIFRFSRNFVETVGSELFSLRNLTELDLSRNRIKNLDPLALKNLKNLRKLRLGNNRIESLPPYFFRRTKRLVYIDLHNNRIKMIYEAFQGLLQLQELLLFNNSIINIDRLSMGNVPNLRILRAAHNSITNIRKYGPVNVAIEELDLRHCNISEVDSQAFQALGDLKKLDVSENWISYISESAFHKQSKLENLNAAKNVIVSVYRSFNKTQRMRTLNLSMNMISNITEAFSELRSLTSLTLRMNEIPFVEDSTFTNTGNLKRLNLSYNKIRWLGQYCLKGLVNLKVLLLNNNLLLKLNGSLSHMPMLRYIFLEENNLEVLEMGDFENDPQLGFIYAFRNNLTSINGAFRHLRNLKAVLLQRNRLQAIHRQSFPPSLDKIQTLVIEANPIVCDCQLSWLLTDAVHVTKHGMPRCEGPSWLKGDLLYNLTLENLTAWKEGCDQKCTCECVDDGSFGRDVFVDCSDGDLTQLPVTLPLDTVALDLSGNNLESLDSGTSEETAGLAKNAPFLRFLNLSNNLLSSIGPSAIPRGTKELSLRGNRMAHFPIDLVSNINLSNLELAGNPWSCGCEEYAFRQWAEAYSDIIDDAEQITCAEGPNRLVSLKLFMDLGQKDLCPSMMSTILSYGLPLLVLLIISLAASTAYLRHKRAIKVWLYARGLCSSLQCIKEDDLDEDKIFDVFLSFSSKDATWAYEQLIPGVEAQDFSVCTYDRNFKGGFLLQDIIQEAVSCSRRTLLLLTQTILNGIHIMTQGLPHSSWVVISENGYVNVWKPFCCSAQWEATACNLPRSGIRLPLYFGNFSEKGSVSRSFRTSLMGKDRGNFVESEWCRWEFRVAHRQAFEDKINRLIVVLVDEVTPDLVDEELRLYMQATNYLRWGEPHFWDKLIYSLPKKDSKRRLILSTQEYPMTVKSESAEP